MEMERQNKKMQVWNLLAEKIRKLVEESVSNPEELQEIRIRTGQPLLIQMKGQERVLPDPVHPYLVTKEDIGETMGYICHYSLYAYENELKQGFITVEGGHRVGVAGKVIIENEKVNNLDFFINWSLLSKWSINFRYMPPGTHDANTSNEYINAIEKENGGVYPWIKKRW